MADAYVSVALRRLVHERAAGCCEYCLCRGDFIPDPMAIEHIVPESAGGMTDSENLALACTGCNGFKGARVEAVDPLTGTSVGLFNPRRERWSAHFTWNPDCSEILGLTPTGRATVGALRLNRLGLVNLRVLLFLNGLHPPVKQER